MWFLFVAAAMTDSLDAPVPDGDVITTSTTSGAMSDVTGDDTSLASADESSSHASMIYQVGKCSCTWALLYRGHHHYNVIDL